MLTFKETLAAQVKTSQTEKQKLAEENATKLEQLHSLLNDARCSLASANEKNSALETGKKDIASKLSTLQKDKARLERDLQETVDIDTQIKLC